MKKLGEAKGHCIDHLQGTGNKVLACFQPLGGESGMAPLLIAGCRVNSIPNISHFLCPTILYCIALQYCTMYLYRIYGKSIDFVCCNILPLNHYKYMLSYVHCTVHIFKYCIMEQSNKRYSVIKYHLKV